MCTCLFVVCWLQCIAETNVTLAFEDAQVIPPFFWVETDDKDDRDATDNTYDRDDTGDTDDTYDTDGKDDSDDQCR